MFVLFRPAFTLENSGDLVILHVETKYTVAISDHHVVRTYSIFPLHERYRFVHNLKVLVGKLVEESLGLQAYL